MYAFFTVLIINGTLFSAAVVERLTETECRTAMREALAVFRADLLPPGEPERRIYVYCQPMPQK